MKKILFFIHDLGQGGAEKVLVNLVNNIDRNKFDVSVIALFGGGVNEQFLKPDIHYKAIWSKMIPGNSQLMKLLTPKQLHHICIKEKYDIEISYLEGPSARLISGCTDKTTKLVSWIHVEQHTIRKLSASFRSQKEACKCYRRFDQTVCVSENVYDDFQRILDFQKPCQVLHNTVESEKILRDAKEPVLDMKNNDGVRLIAIGTLKKSKGYMRLLRIIKRLKDEGYKIHLYGERAGVWYTEIHRKYKYPEFEGENFLTPCITWNRMANDGYKIRIFDDIIWICKYLEDGLTMQGNLRFIKNPAGAGLCLREKANFLHYSLIEKMKMWYTFYCDHTFCENPYRLTKKQCAEYIGAPLCMIYAAAMIHGISKKIKGKK